MTSTVNFKQPKEAENIEMMGVRMSVILSTECSGGKLTIIEQQVDVGAASPVHICTREDKVILVTRGKFLFFADSKKYEAGTGANIFIPRGTLHTFKNTGTLLVTLTSGGH